MPVLQALKIVPQDLVKYNKNIHDRMLTEKYPRSSEQV